MNDCSDEGESVNEELSVKRASAGRYLTQKNKFSEVLDEYNFAAISLIKKSVRTKIEERYSFSMRCNNYTVNLLNIKFRGKKDGGGFFYRNG